MFGHTSCCLYISKLPTGLPLFGGGLGWGQPQQKEGGGGEKLPRAKSWPPPNKHLLLPLLPSPPPLFHSPPRAVLPTPFNPLRQPSTKSIPRGLSRKELWRGGTQAGGEMSPIQDSQISGLALLPPPTPFAVICISFSERLMEKTGSWCKKLELV